MIPERSPASRRSRSGLWMIAAAAAALAGASATLAQGTPAPPTNAATIPEAEDADVATLPAISPHWAFLTDGWSLGGTRIVDGDTGKLAGIVHNGPLANFAIDPMGRFFYMAESIWTRGNRGKRQDLLVVYDAKTLKILSEINLPGRLLIGNRQYNLTVSADGKTAYVYNMDPASSVLVVDLVARKFARTIEVPGCGLAMPTPDGTIVSLCSDGSLATVAYDPRRATTPKRSPVFFSADKDPIFDNSVADGRTGKALFLTYSGLIYEAALGATPSIGQPWSIQEAGGMARATTAPLAVNWLPGGREPIAYHRDSGKAYILMHIGEFWSQKAPGEELWEIDVASHKVLRRKKLTDKIDNIVVTQGAAPLIFLNTDEGKLFIWDAATLEQKHDLKGVGTGNLAVAGS
jgi:methylamine dehydrogenase heavy chain